MKELKVGERVVLEITETEEETCYGCFFFGNSACENSIEEVEEFVECVNIWNKMCEDEE